MKMYLVVWPPYKKINTSLDIMVSAIKQHLEQLMKVYLADANTNLDVALAQREIHTMKMYLVSSGGITKSNHSLGTLAESLNTRSLRVLLSFFYFKNVSLHEVYTQLFQGDPIDTFLDSGGFSAATQGASVNISEYCEYIKVNKRFITTYANLDVIGDAKETLANQHQMEQEGLHPIPVFHVGEDWHYLENYIERYPYIALGGMVPNLRRDKRKHLMIWLLRCFKMAQGKSVYHGFGCTSWDVVKAFPWYSVDSSSWGEGFRYGQLALFDQRKGSFVKANLGNHETCYRIASVFRTLGFDPADFSNRSRNTRQKICAISALSYFQAEDWLERRHGTITIPERVTV